VSVTQRLIRDVTVAKMRNERRAVNHGGSVMSVAALTPRRDRGSSVSMLRQHITLQSTRDT